MRNLLSELITQNARQDPDFIVLSGDHGYALFDSIRKHFPRQFLNVGVMEQGMVGIAAGLCKQGYRPMLYGLSAFVPIRVLEQIKLDICVPGLPVTFVGDGAGLVYSTLGVSHQCAEDIAVLRPLPRMSIYAPADAEELRACWMELGKQGGPRYLRIGKGDRAPVALERLESCEPRFTHRAEGARACLVAHGSMVSPATGFGRKLGLSVVSVPRLKPLGATLEPMLRAFPELIVIEEHSRYGGLASALAELFCESRERPPRLRAVTLGERFAETCGSYQHALSEHGLADHQLESRIRELLEP